VAAAVVVSRGARVSAPSGHRDGVLKKEKGLGDGGAEDGEICSLGGGQQRLFEEREKKEGSELGRAKI
jgi:hypothetical protein